MMTTLYIFSGIVIILVLKYFIDTKAMTLTDLIRIKNTLRQDRDTYWLRNKKFRAFQMNPNCRIFKRKVLFRETETLRYPDSVENIKKHQSWTSDVNNPLTYITPEFDFVEFEPYSGDIRRKLQNMGFRSVKHLDIKKEESIGHFVITRQIKNNQYYFLNDKMVEFYYGENLAICLMPNTKTIEIYDKP